MGHEYKHRNGKCDHDCPFYDETGIPECELTGLRIYKDTECIPYQSDLAKGMPPEHKLPKGKAKQVGDVVHMAAREVLDAWEAYKRHNEPTFIMGVSKAMDGLKKTLERPLKPGEHRIRTPTGMEVTIGPVDALTKSEGLFCGVCGRPMEEQLENTFFRVESGKLDKAATDRIKRFFDLELERAPELGRVQVIDEDTIRKSGPLVSDAVGGVCQVWECPICGARFEDEGNRSDGPGTFGQDDWFFRDGVWWHNHGDKGGHCPARVIDVKLKEGDPDEDLNLICPVCFGDTMTVEDRGEDWPPATRWKLDCPACDSGFCYPSLSAAIASFKNIGDDHDEEPEGV